MRRRWLLLVPGLLLTAGLTWAQPSAPPHPRFEDMLVQRLQLKPEQAAKASGPAERFASAVKITMDQFRERVAAAGIPSPEGRRPQDGPPTLTAEQADQLDDLEDGLDDEMLQHRMDLELELRPMLTAKQRLRLHRLLARPLPPPGPLPR
ncbi:MAG: hypothetical protein ACYCW6_32090 [Candidatus Xenobia bacterium]